MFHLPEADHAIGASFDDLGRFQRSAMRDDNVDLVIIVVPSDPAKPSAEVGLEEARGLALECNLSRIIDFRRNSLFKSREFGQGRQCGVTQHVGRGVKDRR